MVDRTTIVTKSGEEVSGKEVARDTHPPETLPEFVGRTLLAMATGGLSECIRPDTVVVKDDEGNYVAGRPK